jgi:hypothetical protein
MHQRTSFVWKEPNTVPALAQPSRSRLSYTTNHSILWAIIHGIFSWLYVIYFALFRA